MGSLSIGRNATSVDPNQKMPTNQVIGLLASFIFISFPPFILVKEGPIFLFGDNPLLYLHVYSAIGGAICGVSYGKEMKFIGFVSGIVSALGGTALFWYYVFYPPVREFIYTSDIIVPIGLGGLPGVGLYLAIKKARIHFAKSRGT